MKVHRILVTVGMALAVAAVLGSGAQAADRPDDRAGMIGVGAAQVVVAPPDAVERAVLRQASVAAPDVLDRAVLRRADATVVRPDDRAGVRGAGPAPIALPSVTADSGFRWGDVLFGAAGVLGVLLLGAVATATLRHRSRAVLR